MKIRGWDGSEDLNKQKWTFPGSLFYSIVLISTIGYGDQTPKTQWGKVWLDKFIISRCTKFYFIAGDDNLLYCGNSFILPLSWSHWRNFIAHIQVKNKERFTFNFLQQLNSPWVK